MITSQPLSICYLLEDTALFGGVKVVLHQANLLHHRGHRVVVASKGPLPAWWRLDAEFVQVPEFRNPFLPTVDVVVATYWTTLEPALALGDGEVVHYCQGFEASYTHNRAEHSAIREVYGRPVPALTVAPHLSELLAASFRRPSRVVTQPLDDFWQPRDSDLTEGRPPRILVTSPFEIDWKGVETSLEAVQILRRRETSCTLVRLSQWPQGESETSIIMADEFHTHLQPKQAAEVVRSCDLMLAASWEQEGFGLPLLEALASGVPAVASNISSFRYFASESSSLVPFNDPVAFADAAQSLLTDRALWQERRRAGLRVAGEYSEPNATQSAEDAFRWVASGAWKGEWEALQDRGKA